MTQEPLHCVALSLRNVKYSNFAIFRDKTQEPMQHRDRIRVYPCVASRCDKCQSEGDAMLRKPLRHILNWALGDPKVYNLY